MHCYEAVYIETRKKVSLTVTMIYIFPLFDACARVSGSFGMSNIPVVRLRKYHEPSSSASSKFFNLQIDTLPTLKITKIPPRSLHQPPT